MEEWKSKNVLTFKVIFDLFFFYSFSNENIIILFRMIISEILSKRAH